MTLVEKLKWMDGLTKGICEAYHYIAPAKSVHEPPYIVWTEAGEAESMHGDNHKAEQIIEFEIELYVVDQYDEVIDAVQGALDTGCLSWTYDGSSLELETGLVHHSWVCQI